MELSGNVFPRNAGYKRQFLSDAAFLWAGHSSHPRTNERNAPVTGRKEDKVRIAALVGASTIHSERKRPPLHERFGRKTLTFIDSHDIADDPTHTPTWRQTRDFSVSCTHTVEYRDRARKVVAALGACAGRRRSTMDHACHVFLLLQQL